MTVQVFMSIVLNTPTIAYLDNYNENVVHEAFHIILN